ncbi:MAG: ComEC family competence protein [Candidatus Zixiibacteriota bacterium]|nr:MAG: ComEC family competence protein [candidate division Zixibacteria bacterium]
MIRKFPSVFLLIFIVTGIVMADQSRWPSWLFLLVCLVPCLGGFLALTSPRKMLATVLFCFSLLGFSAFRFAAGFYDAGPNHISSFDLPGGSYHIYGEVSDWPDLRSDRTEFKIAIDSIVDSRCHRLIGFILLRVSDTTTALQRGDRVEFHGRIYPVRQQVSPGSFDYGRHLNMRGVFGIVYVPTLLDVRVDRRNRYGFLSMIDRLRDAIRASLYQNLSSSSAALASGFLIGETRDIPIDVYQRFRDSGTLHLLAVSGSNVALIVVFFVFLLRPLKIDPTRRALVLLAVILIFAFLSYGEPSVVRASVMAGLIIVAGLLHRRHNLNNIIATAAAIILLVDPAQLFDVGFQLSFCIAWGLIFIVPRVTEFFKPVQSRWWYRWLLFPLLISVIAQICSMGLIAYYFDRVPLISPLANLVVVPIVSAAVIGTLILLVANLILPVLALFFGAWLNLLLECVLKLVETFGSDTMPALSVVNMPMWVNLLIYAYIFLAAWSLGKKYVRRLVLISLLMLANLILLVHVFDDGAAYGEAEVTLFSIPGGAAAVVKRLGGNDADLIITGIRGRNYPVDERIIGPCLDELGVVRLGTVFVLSAEFDAIDDVLRLTRTYPGSRLYVERSDEPSFKDVIASDTAGDSGSSILTFGDTVAEYDRKGAYYCPTGWGLLLSVNGSKVFFCDYVLPAHLNADTKLEGAVLVVGQTWRSTGEDLAGIRRRGFSQIVCSKIAQPRYHEESMFGHQPPRALPVNVYDLSRRGRLTLNL